MKVPEPRETPVYLISLQMSLKAMSGVHMFGNKVFITSVVGSILQHPLSANFLFEQNRALNYNNEFANKLPYKGHLKGKFI